MSEDFDKILGIERDENGVVTKLVLENEDHSISRVSPPMPDSGDEITVTSGSVNFNFGTPIPFTGLLNDPPLGKIGEALSWDVDNPTYVVCEEAGRYTAHGYFQAIGGSLCAGIMGMIATRTVNGTLRSPGYYFHQRASKFTGLGASMMISLPELAMGEGERFGLLGHAFDGSGAHVEDAVYTAILRVVKVG